ncbi:MAG: hypothetical protein M3010_05285 [Candidatus Dormibacteraeota bacterium]|nr:hypothetical protein [Candidatus Dormibacteraeota bacterium]
MRMEGQRRQPGTPRLMAVAASCVLLAACSSAPTHAGKPSPTPSAAQALRTATVSIDQVPAAEQNAYVALNLTVAPPETLGRKVALPADIENHTGGKVDDATTKKWAEAEVREGDWETWAVENLQSPFLNELAPAASQVDVFHSSRDWINQAQAKSARLKDPQPTIEKMVLVPMADVTRQRLQTLGLPASDYAWVITQSDGAAGVPRLVHPDGHVEALITAIPPHQKILISGRLRDDNVVLGPIWSQESTFLCDGPYERPTCDV